MLDKNVVSRLRGASKPEFSGEPWTAPEYGSAFDSKIQWMADCWEAAKEHLSLLEHVSEWAAKPPMPVGAQTKSFTGSFETDERA